MGGFNRNRLLRANVTNGQTKDGKCRNIGTLSVQELFFQLIGWLGVKLGVSPVGMVYFMG